MPTPIVEWDFSTANYAGGTAVTDVSGNGNNGVINSTPTSWNSTVGWIELSSAQECRVPNANYPNNLPVGTVAKSMVYWGTIPTYDTTAFTFGGNGGGGSRIDIGYGFGYGPGLEFSGVGYYSATYTPGLNTFFQLVFTSNSNGTIVNSLVYIDGILRPMTAIGSLANTIDVLGTPGDALTTLALNWQVVPGNIKVLNARVYDVVLSAGEVATDYTNFLNRLSPTPPPPLSSPGPVGGRRFGGRFNG